MPWNGDTGMTYEAAMVVMRKPGWFSTREVHGSCEFIINNAPPSHIRCDHEANVNQARVVSWANHEAIMTSGGYDSSNTR
jgi:hypothetical protein